MPVSLCIRQGSKRNDDSVSVEELDCSAENQVLFDTAEHFWCDFTCRPWAKNLSPNTNNLYIHYMDKSTGTPPSLEEKTALSKCGNKMETFHLLKKCISTSVATVLKCMKWLYPYVIGTWCQELSKGVNTCQEIRDHPSSRIFPDPVDSQLHVGAPSL